MLQSAHDFIEHSNELQIERLVLRVYMLWRHSRVNRADPSIELIDWDWNYWNTSSYYHACVLKFEHNGQMMDEGVGLERITLPDA